MKKGFVPRHLIFCILTVPLFVLCLSWNMGIDDVGSEEMAEIQDSRNCGSFCSLVEAEKKLWDQSAAQQKTLLKHFAGMSPQNATFSKTLRTKLEAIPQCHALGGPFLDYLHKYLLVNYYEPGNGDAARLVYKCESHKANSSCGGMGDRFRGIISAFWLAILSRRKFELYHPTPIPLQKFMPPYLVNYIPSLRKKRSSRWNGADLSSPKAYRESLSALISSAAGDSDLMRTALHKRYMHKLKKANRWVPSKPVPGSDRWWHPNYTAPDILLYTNSLGVDRYLHMNKELLDVKEHVLALKNCDISCYFGCLFHILLQPSERLWEAAVQTLQKSNDEVLMASLNAVKNPAPGQLFPFVSLQVRVAGSWANGLRVKEKFRTYPWSLPHYYSMVREVVSGVPWRLHPEYFPRGNLLWDKMQRNDAAVVLFVSSDSSRLIEETRRLLAGNPRVRVVHTEGDSFRHTDTLQLDKLDGRHYSRAKEAEDERAYFLTHLNNYLLRIASHSIISASGFSMTAFWASRQSASAIYVHMVHEDATQIHYRYIEAWEGNNTAQSAVAVKVRTLHDLHATPTPFYT